MPQNHLSNGAPMHVNSCEEGRVQCGWAWMVKCWVLGLLAMGVMGTRAWSQIQFDAFLGYDGVVPELAWFPVTFEIKNDGPGFVGRIEVAERTMGRTSDRVTTVELPTGTLKRLTVPSFSSQAYVREWEARLLDEKGRVRASTVVQAKHRVSWRYGSFGTLARGSAQSPVLPNIPLKNQDNPAVAARWLVDLFPDNGLLMDGISTVYLNSEKALALKEPQVNALVSWLFSGGHLIVAVEAPGDLGGAPWLRRLLPGMPGASRSVRAGPFLHEYATNDWPSLEKRLQDRASREGFVEPRHLNEDPTFANAAMNVWETPVPKDATAISGGGATLMIGVRRGWGRVTMLTFNPEREPFASWTHREWFWGTLAGLPAVVRAENPSYGQHCSDAFFGTILDSRQIHKLPVGWLILLLLIYLVIIGPLDRWWLKRINRPMLTWITFPAYVAVFSALIYYLGYKLRAGESEWNELQVVDVVPWGQTTQARVRSYGSAYSPENIRHEFGGLPSQAVFRSEAYIHGATEAQKGLVEQNGWGYRAKMPIPVWTSRLFVQESWETNALPLKVTLRDDEKLGTMVRMENGLSSKISTAYLVKNGKLYTLTLIPTGASERKLTDLSVSDLGNQMREKMVPVRRKLERRAQTFGFHEEKESLSALPLDVMLVASLGSQRWMSEGEHDYFSVSTTAGMDLSDAPTSGQALLLAWIPNTEWIPSMARFQTKRSAKQMCVRMLVNRETTQAP